MSDGQSAPQEKWVTAAKMDQVSSGTVLAVELDGRDLALINVEGKVYCTDNICTHAYALLSDGWLEGAILECPLHGGQFDVTNGKPLCAPVTEALAVYRTRTADGDIQVLLPEHVPSV